MSVRRCQAEVDADEFSEWEAFYSLEPFGDWWRCAGEICAAIVNTVGGLFGGKPRCVPEDWMPGQGEAAEEKRRRIGGDMEAAMQDVEWAERMRG